MRDLQTANAQAIHNDDRNQPPESKPNRRGLDPELQAMARLDKILSELPDEAVDRVLFWLNGRYAKPAPMLGRAEVETKGKP